MSADSAHRPEMSREPDQDWTTEFVSAGVDLVGYAPHHFMGPGKVSWDVILHPEDRDRVHATVRLLVNRNPPFTTRTHVVSYRLLTATGEQKHVRDSFRFVHDDSGAAVALEGVITDITQLTLANERVRESEGRYRLLAENINDLVCLHDPDGTLLYVSPSAVRVLGFSPEELTGTLPCSLIHPDDRPRSKCLQQAGYDVMGARNTQEAMGHLAEVVPDVIVSDIMMPGPDGYALVQHVRSNPGPI